MFFNLLKPILNVVLSSTAVNNEYRGRARSGWDDKQHEYDPRNCGCHNWFDFYWYVYQIFVSLFPLIAFVLLL